jgi:hypothetical protein
MKYYINLWEIKLNFIFSKGAQHIKTGVWHKTPHSRSVISTKIPKIQWGKNVPLKKHTTNSVSNFCLKSAASGKD